MTDSGAFSFPSRLKADVDYLVQGVTGLTGQDLPSPISDLTEKLSNKIQPKTSSPVGSKIGNFLRKTQSQPQRSPSQQASTPAAAASPLESPSSELPPAIVDSTPQTDAPPTPQDESKQIASTPSGLETIPTSTEEPAGPSEAAKPELADQPIVDCDSKSLKAEQLDETGQDGDINSHDLSLANAVPLSDKEPSPANTEQTGETTLPESDSKTKTDNQEPQVAVGPSREEGANDEDVPSNTMKPEPGEQATDDRKPGSHDKDKVKSPAHETGNEERVRDHYTILGVRPNASEEEIRKSYRRLVKQVSASLRSGGL